jgi:hypothetical protein
MIVKNLAVSISKVLRLITTLDVGHYADSSFLLRGHVWWSPEW